jgi:protocatechuate 3,4-dioxygenase beta subunit
MSQNDESISLISRRQALILLGAAGATMVLQRRSVYSASVKSKDGTLPACIVTPKQTEGPFFVDERLQRSDIRVDPSDGRITPGVPLRLTFRVSAMEGAGCKPLSGALVDVWQCDAIGVYSGVNDSGSHSSSGAKLLRGYQVTQSDGSTQFTTIYPGWYPGRTVHIHFKVRVSAKSGRGQELTSQLYFDDALTDRIHAQSPYAGKGPRTVRNQRDGLFRNGGRQLMLSPVQSGDGYLATFDIGLQMT